MLTCCLAKIFRYLCKYWMLYSESYLARLIFRSVWRTALVCLGRSDSEPGFRLHRSIRIDAAKEGVHLKSDTLRRCYGLAVRLRQHNASFDGADCAFEFACGSVWRRCGQTTAELSLRCSRNTAISKVKNYRRLSTVRQKRMKMEKKKKKAENTLRTPLNREYILYVQVMGGSIRNFMRPRTHRHACTRAIAKKHNSQRSRLIDRCLE